MFCRFARCRRRSVRRRRRGGWWWYEGEYWLPLDQGRESGLEIYLFYLNRHLFPYSAGRRSSSTSTASRIPIPDYLLSPRMYLLYDKSATSRHTPSATALPTTSTVVSAITEPPKPNKNCACSCRLSSLLMLTFLFLSFSAPERSPRPSTRRRIRSPRAKDRSPRPSRPTSHSIIHPSHPSSPAIPLPASPYHPRTRFPPASTPLPNLHIFSPFRFPSRPRVAHAPSVEPRSSHDPPSPMCTYPYSYHSSHTHAYIHYTK